MRGGVAVLAVMAATLAAVPTSLAGQASLYGVVGLGLPGQPVGPRARALGWGLLAFDGSSAVNPATIGLYPRLTVEATATSSFRGFSTGATSVDGLRQTRFLFGQVAGRLGRSPLSFGASFGPYLDRTFDITSIDTITLRGETVEVADRISADGGVSDVRAALAWRISRQLQVGGAIHFLTGSTRLATTREFSDTSFVALRDSTQAAFQGTGLSVGLLYTFVPRASIGLAFRSDGRLKRTIDSVETDRVDLPISVTVGLAVAPQRALRWSATATWRNWSDVDLAGTRSFDTWAVGSGIELGGPDIGASRIPLRLGVRYAQLPFSPNADQPHEWIVTVGSAYPFASNRALIEATLERILRDGAGAQERVWQLTLGLSLIP